MKADQRKLASIDLTKTFFNSYASDWRLTKVLALKKIIDHRYEFYEDILSQINDLGLQENETSIAQEIHNGLHHDAIAQCIQYIEDLFALISATKQPDFFVRNITTYKAGNVTDSIKRYKVNGKNIINDFFIPKEVMEVAKDQKEITDAVESLVKLVEDSISFYKKYWFFYNQYKHGLSIPMRTFGNVYSQEQVQLDKKGEMKPIVVVYDNLNLNAASKKGTFDPNQGLMMMGFTENVRPVMEQLMNENNFLRLAYPSDRPNFSIEILVEQAYKTRACLNVLAINFMKHIEPEDGLIEFQLPDVDYKSNKAINCSYNLTE